MSWSMKLRGWHSAIYSNLSVLELKENTNSAFLLDIHLEIQFVTISTGGNLMDF